MQVVRDPAALTRDERTVLTLGTFDGVHLGHRAIIGTLTDAAHARGWRSVLLTFDPHPRDVLGGSTDGVFLLSTIDERLGMFEALGIDCCVVMPFTRDLSLLEPEEFFRRIFLESIGVGAIVVGFDHAFGKGRHGHIDELRRLGAQYKVDIDIVPQYDIEGVKVSSTAVRHALLRGDVAQATRFLGRPYTLDGIVQRGEGLGRTIGFPTANIVRAHARKLLPAAGVYAVRVTHGDAVHAGMMNIGRRPTVSVQEHLSVEVHLFDFTGDLYGDALEIAVIARIRDEHRFASLDELRSKLEQDRSEALALLAHDDTNYRIHLQ